MKLLNEYIDAKEKLTKYKKLESELRIELLNELFPNAAEGTITTTLNGLEVKGGFKMSLKLDRKGFEEDLKVDAFTDEELECIDFKPAIILSKYKALGEDEREHLDEYISVSPAMPTVTIKLAEELNHEY